MRPRQTSRSWLVAARAACAAAVGMGCGVEADVLRGLGEPGVECGAAGHLPPVGAAVSERLLAAVDEAPDIIPRLIRPEPTPETEEPRGRRSRLGVRVGYLMPSSAQRGTWDAAVRTGLYYRRKAGSVFEFGLDYATLRGEFERSGLVETTLYFARFDALFGPWDRAGEGSRLYLLTGGEIGQENARWDASGEGASRTGSALNLGMGIGSRSGSWDARAVYSLYVNADNAAGTVLAAVGFSF